ncbi:HEAT repeat domain-containing protein [Haloarcula amylovorans]|uniref:HEAT repeat domain-containing protein n=1 Tax=Haloarcula amylovorans TaxID=2562280 RepID=UPI0014309595|nr:HEAT repeat domain-containing protein [Halomicroarcula amylolytica]
MADTDDDLNTKTVSILVADVKDYSKLEPFQYQRFFSEVLSILNEKLSDHGAAAKNSWGDGIFATFNDPRSSARAALDIRDLFKNHPWQEMGLPNLEIRIALHMGTVYEGHNPIREEQGVVGTNVNLTARIEPVTVANHVFSSDIFRKNIEAERTENEFAFDKFPEKKLAKDWGEEDVHHLRRPEDPQLTPDDVVASDDNEVQSESEASALESFFETGSVDDQIRAVDILANRGNRESMEILINRLLDDSIQGRVRKQIAGRLDKFDDKRVVDPLQQVIADNDQHSVVNNSLASLKQLAEKGVVGIEILDTLEKVLNSDEYPDRFKAFVVTIMGEFNDHRVVEPLEKVLTDSEGTNSEVRRRAANALTNQERAVAVGPLIEALDDRDPEVRFQAVTSLGTVGSVQAVEPIVELLLDETEGYELRVKATDALEEIGDLSVANHIEEISDISNSEVRAAVMHMFGELGVVRMLPKIEQIAADSDATKRERELALASIGMFGKESSIKILETLMDETNDDIRIRAVQALGNIPSESSREILMEVLSAREEYIAEMRRTAAIALRKQGKRDATDTLIQATTDPIQDVRKSAMEALADLGGVKADQHLMDICGNQDDYHNFDRAIAAWQLRKAVNERKAVQTLLHLLEKEGSAVVIHQIINALGVVGNKAAAEPIVEYATDESYDRDLREAAIQALGLIGDPIAEEPAKQIIHNESNAMVLRRFALFTLRNLDTASAQQALDEIIENEDFSQEIHLMTRHVKQIDANQIKQALQDARDEALNEAEAEFE